MKQSSALLTSALVESLKGNPTKHKIIIERFFKYLIAHKQQKLLPSILRKIDELENKNALLIETARPVNEATKKSLSALAQKIFPSIKNPNITFRENPELIGGFTFKSIYQELHMSILNNLDQLKEQL